MSTHSLSKWSIDAMHSEVEFKVKHLMISTVTGKFSIFNADIEASNEDFTDAKITFTADVKSISTGNQQRDGHLQSDDFFNSESFPQIKFVSTGMSKNKLVGNLTIRSETKSVELDVDYNGKMNDPYGNTKAGFEVSGKINRSDFDLKWSATTEAGGIVVSDEVKIICNIQLIKVA
jgi:polyisoprenoid-binding protein YceI